MITALTQEEINILSSVGIVAQNWYAVKYPDNQMPFAIFQSEEHAKAYRDQFCATGIIEPYGMKIKDYTK